MTRAMRTLTGSLFISLAPLASAQEESDPAAGRIASGFVSLAGSDDNALALVLALRAGAPVRLTAPIPPLGSETPEVTLIVPPTGSMNWNDVKMALMLARDALQRYNIVRPSGEQLQAALTGGYVITPNGRRVNFRGVLQMRAEGLNWGRIAAERYRRPEVTSRSQADFRFEGLSSSLR